MDVYIESGKRWIFAGALEWPGWCRRGRDEQQALDALLAYRDRYRRALGPRARGLPDPEDAKALRIVEHLPGDATTDFGAPGAQPAADRRPIDAAELKRMTGMLEACWKAFDAITARARGATLRPGARGGGRDLAAIEQHVLEADGAYMRAVGGTARMTDSAGARTTHAGSARAASAATLRTEFKAVLAARARGELPDVGPRGGKRWGTRYAIRRSAWHVLDHAWEIEDRLEP